MDVRGNQKAEELFAPMMGMLKKGLGIDTEEAGGAFDTVGNDMEDAFLWNMPLRGVVSFGGGKITYEQIQEMVDQINGEDTKN
jgi:beta-glucosidase